MVSTPRRLLLVLALVTAVAATATATRSCRPALGLATRGSAAEPELSGDDELGGPGPAPADVFYPGFDAATDELPAPKRGGRVIVHLEALPKHMNYMVENSTYTRNMLYEAHEFLVNQDWETWEYSSVLAKEVWKEDTVVLEGGRGEGNANVHYGRVTDAGDAWLVTPLSKGNPLIEPLKVPKSEVESVERETVFTFDLRADVTWQDGHPFDAGDVEFSWECYGNPNVQCDWIRFKARDLFAHFERVDDHCVRFFYSKQYFLAFETFTGWMLLPAHLYDLSDPKCPDYDPETTAEEQGRYVNENPHNNEFVGLGPYRITEYNQQYVEAKRYDGYFDKENGGWFDTIRWRHISDDEAAAQALLNNELDFTSRVSTENYFGEFVQRPEFTTKYYKGYYYSGYMSYIGWNMKRPLFADQEVRLALAHAMDWEGLLDTLYKGLGMRVTSTFYRFGPNYDESIRPVPFDLDRASELLEDAGWYDRDGDGVIDKDGVPFEFDYLTSTGNKSSALTAQQYMDNLSKIGIKVNIATREWATFLERIYARDFDCTALAWTLPVESDPYQLWHGSQANKRSSNRVGLEDPETDRLIEAIQREIDPAKRAALYHDLHARLYELQPYNFGLNVPRKFAMSKRIRNFQTFAISPGYSIRRWYRADA